MRQRTTGRGLTTRWGFMAMAMLALAWPAAAQAEEAEKAVESTDLLRFAQAEPGSETADLDAAGEGAFDEPFAAGSWTFQAYGSGTVGDNDHGNIYTAHVGGGYYLYDDFSVNLELLGGWVDSRTDDDGYVGGLDLLLRWHFLKGENDAWTIYSDGGAGIQMASTDFPSDSPHNFRPQFGLGGTLRLNDEVRLMGGARYLHISNAGTTNGNDGGDWAQLYLGVMVPF